MKIGARLWLAACCLFFLTVSSGCGRKTALVIPDSPRPEAVKDVKAASRDAVVFLSWPIPTRNVEGRSMIPADIQLFRIYRADLGRDKKKGRYKLYAEIDMQHPGTAVISNNMVFWNDDQVKYGYLYGYRIRAISARGGVSSWPEEVRIRPLLSPSVPAGLAAQGGDGYSLVTWASVTIWADASNYDGYVGYNIYRGTEKGQFDEAPLNKEPLREPLYKDSSVVNSRTYYYMIRSVNNPAPPWKESLDSAIVSATPRDMTPPGRPTGLTAVPGIDRVFLTWNENKERDLAGYRVYRSTRSGRDYERLTEALHMRTTFSDETAKGGATYYYCITAVDQSGNESARSEERKVRVERQL